MVIASRSPNCALRRSRSKPNLRRPNKFDRCIDVVVGRLGSKIVRLELSGHAGFAPAGTDIVCAAVSALVLTAARGVVRHGGAKALVRDDPNGAYVLEIPGGGGARAQAVLETALDGLQAIARSYPGRVRVRRQPQGRATASRKR